MRSRGATNLILKWVVERNSPRPSMNGMPVTVLARKDGAGRHGQQHGPSFAGQPRLDDLDAPPLIRTQGEAEFDRPRLQIGSRSFNIDLQVEQAVKIELTLTLKTAKALGLTIPETLGHRRRGDPIAGRNLSCRRQQRPPGGHPARRERHRYCQFIRGTSPYPCLIGANALGRVAMSKALGNSASQVPVVREPRVSECWFHVERCVVPQHLGQGNEGGT